jgi:hypothetical protein
VSPVRRPQRDPDPVVEIDVIPSVDPVRMDRVVAILRKIVDTASRKREARRP